MIIFNNKDSLSHKNRGIDFENNINITNDNYKIDNLALVYKKSTPIKILVSGETNKAVFSKKSTTDYNGVYKGKYIDFEAKSTHENNFPLKNIEDHQIEHLKNVLLFDGISFLLVEFKKYNEIYILKTQDLLNFIENNDKSAIPYEYFKNKGFLINSYIKYPVHYLENFEKIFEF